MPDRNEKSRDTLRGVRITKKADTRGRLFLQLHSVVVRYPDFLNHFELRRVFSEKTVDFVGRMVYNHRQLL